MEIVSDPHDASTIKISPSLAEALPELGDEQVTRIIVLLETPGVQPSPPGRRNGRRSKDFESIRAAARPALASVDETLATHGGRRLSEDVDALGSISVDATRATVSALSSLPDVRAVLADQPLRGVTSAH